MSACPRNSSLNPRGNRMVITNYEKLELLVGTSGECCCSQETINREFLQAEQQFWDPAMVVNLAPSSLLASCTCSLGYFLSSTTVRPVAPS